MFKLGVKLLIRSASIVNKSTLFILFMRVTVYLHYKCKNVFLLANKKHSADRSDVNVEPSSGTMANH